MAKLEGKTAIITGGTAGIGRGIAIKMAEEGARVLIFGRNEQRGNEVVDEIKNGSGSREAVFYQVDVANHSEVGNVIKEILRQEGKVDILINNAGITRDQLLMRMSEKDWDDVMDINVKSCYNLSHALVRHMMKVRSGKIINISSVVGITGNTGQANYAASKAAIIGFTKALAKELASREICVNCVAPGFIDTQMTEVLNEEQQKATLAQIPMGRMGSTDDIANVVLFLSGSESDYITGQVLTVDGGMVM
ncbi:MAG: 3-oxoacyl-ACP reductase FabG [Chlamydiota bacterium]|nr:3-oxoacyl-ACP reductase FabG [Chlamydiota bacterium]